MSSTPLHHLTISQASTLILSRALSPVDLVEAFIERIAAIDGQIHSYLTVVADRALKAARVAEAEIMAGRWRGPLHGIPFAVKDNYHTIGIPTIAASRLMADYMPDETATTVTRLEAAGAILLGKLNMWEYGTGTGAVYDDLPYPIARNPWDLDCFTGGSSTGAGAGVAAGTCMFALGSDTGGSIRLPAAACGLTGLKATYGRVSRAGCLPNCWSLDVTGPLTWSVEDTAIVMQALAGYDPLDPASADEPVPDYRANLHGGVDGLVIGVVREFIDGADGLEDEQAIAIGAAAQQLKERGAIIRDVHLPAPLSHYRDVTRIINWGESYAIHERDFMERSASMGQSLREKMMGGFSLRAVDYIQALRLRRSLADATDNMIKTCDAVLIAGAFLAAPRLADSDQVRAYTSETATPVFNVTGHPSMSVPTGFNGRGLPLNMQIVGRYFDEATVMRVGAAHEAAMPPRPRPAL